MNRYYIQHGDLALLEALQAPVNLLDNFVRYEYIRLLEQLDEHVEQLEERLAAHTSLIDKVRADAPRVARKLRSMVRRFGGRRAS